MRHLWKMAAAEVVDGATFGFMNLVQLRHASRATPRDQLETYIAGWEGKSRDEYFAHPPVGHFLEEGERGVLRWTSAIDTGFEEGNRVHVDLYPCSAGWSAPTVIMLHALMSASDTGYKRWARLFNERGWNACFVHLPYHYSRTPRGFLNGEFAISSDIIRLAEGLRQGVCDLRQLMDWLRGRGCDSFGLWATSYGGWLGSLLSFVEKDFHFLALMEPIVNLDHAIWESPAGSVIRRQLRVRGIDEALLRRHFPLTSPHAGVPLCGAERAILIAGAHDRVALAADIQKLSREWAGSRFAVHPQGHMGYTLMRETFELLDEIDVWSRDASCFSGQVR